jgi:carbon-monoxide dehydrogenase medium subunit
MLIGLRSRKHIAPFDIARPTSIAACLSCLSDGRRAVPMAGGLDLIDRMKYGEAIDAVVLLSGIPELQGIREQDGTLVVGALTTHAALARNRLVAETLPDIARLWRGIANPRVRQTGTIGGNLMSALPHYDAMPAFLALGGTATVAEAGADLRSGSFDEFPPGPALLVDVRIPVADTRLVVDRSLHPSVFVYAGATVRSGSIVALRVAIGGAFPRARMVALPAHGIPPASLAAQAAAMAKMVATGLPEPLTDGFAHADYRRRMIEVLTRRALVRLGNAS